MPLTRLIPFPPQPSESISRIYYGYVSDGPREQLFREVFSPQLVFHVTQTKINRRKKSMVVGRANILAPKFMEWISLLRNCFTVRRVWCATSTLSIRGHRIAN